MKTRNLISIILILFIWVFQLSQSAFAGQKLPVLQLSTLKGAPFQGVVDTLKQSGYTPWVVREDDFIFNITPQKTGYVLVPLSKQLNESTLSILSKFVSNGGKLILIPPDDYPDTSVLRLFQALGINVSGSTFAARNMNLSWKGKVLPEPEALPAGSNILAVSPAGNVDVLATFGHDYPAIITTAKGAVLNWQWGRQLSPKANADALARVAPDLKQQVAEADDSAREAAPELEKAPEPSTADSVRKPQVRFIDQDVSDDKPAAPISPVFENNPVLPQPKKQPAVTASKPGPAKTAKPAPATAASKPAVSPVTQQAAAVNATKIPHIASKPADLVKTTADSGPTKSTTSAQPARRLPTVRFIDPAFEPNPSVAKEAPEPDKTAITRPDAGKPASPVALQPSPANTVPDVSTAPAQTVPSRPATPSKAQSTEDEVLGNILGTPAPAQPQGTQPTPATTTGTAEQPQKHFSFLDPDAQGLLAPEFDYGVYSMNMRVLEDYRKKITDAMDLSRQLSLNLPQKRVEALLQETQVHKKQFESLYLNNQTQAGLDEFAKAKRSILQALALTSTSPKVEGRAIWLDRGTILDSGGAAGLRALIQKLHRAGINIVYFETVNAGFPIYPSKITRQNPMVNGWDPLKVAVDEGHRLGMEMHAWVWCFAVGNKRHNQLIGQPESYPGPVLTDDGLMSEALRNQSGDFQPDSRQKEYWLSPASPRGREFLLSLYKEIVSNYDVDGLQLDYIRYPFQTSGSRMGFEPVGRERFAKSTGASLDSLDDYTARVWIAWKTYQVSSFVQQVSESLHKIKPNMKLSAAVFPMKRESRIVAIQQDWETWIDNGWIDTLSPMTYTTEPDRLQEMFESVQASPQKHAIIYPGIALSHLDGGQLVLNLQALREKGGLGATLFAGAQLDQEKVETLGMGPFKETESLPPHRDLVKSLQMILSDYEEKFSKLRGEGALPNLLGDQAKNIEDAIAQFAGTLNMIGSGKLPADIPAFKLQQAQAQLKNLQFANNAWTGADKIEHPYRAQYFDNIISQLDELTGYLVDKSSAAITSTSFREPVSTGAPSGPAMLPTQTPRPVAAGN